MEIIKDSNINYHLHQTEFKKTSKIANYFDYIYNYPPKIKLKWHSIDDLNARPLLHSNDGVVGHSIPFVESLEDWLFNSVPEEGVFKNYSRANYFNGFRDKVNSSNFFNNKKS